MATSRFDGVGSFGGSSANACWEIMRDKSGASFSTYWIGSKESQRADVARAMERAKDYYAGESFNYAFGELRADGDMRSGVLHTGRGSLIEPYMTETYPDSVKPNDLCYVS